MTPTAPQERLLALKEAAERLDVHPATLRRWADKGEIEVVLTPGGHRRFPVSEIARLRSRSSAATGEASGGVHYSYDSSLADATLEHTRQGINEQSGASWREGLDDEDIQEKRALGRRLVELVTKYLHDDDASIVVEARAIGRLYGKSARESGLGLTDALKATFFFRQHIMESVVFSGETGGVRQDIDRETLRRLDHFLNAVELSIAEVLETSSR
ncbi:MAG: helix-turn-helix domain-containing protein [Bacteroidetes bacterium]|nr:helix-turn-helix domain-containing protein [Bacteroidota bacterium]